MLSEYFKQDVMYSLENMTDVELDELLLKIGSIKEKRKKESSYATAVLANRIRTLEDFKHIFRKMMEEDGKCYIQKTFMFSWKVPWLDTSSTYSIDRICDEGSVHYMATEDHTGGTDTDLIGIKEKYSYNELMYELFGDFKHFGAAFTISDSKNMWTSTPDFVREIRSMLDEAMNMAGLPKWQPLNWDFDGDILPRKAAPPEALINSFNYLWEIGKK